MLASSVATDAAMALGWLLPAIAPTLQISVTAGAIAQATTATLVVALKAALRPLNRIAVLEAAALRETR